MSNSNDQAEALKRKAIEAGIMESQPQFAPLREDEENEDPSFPWVHLPSDGVQASTFAREMGCVLKESGLYRYKSGVVTVEVHELTGRPEIRAMTAHRFRSWAECYVVCFKLQFHRKAGAVRMKQTMGVDMAETCLQADEFSRQLPLLTRVNPFQLPVIRASGNCELLPVGYDVETGIYTLKAHWDYDEEMSIEEARHILGDLVKEFPFQDSRSKGVFFAALFSMFGYFLVPSGTKRVNFLFNANSPRSGKTLLVELVLTIAWQYATIDAMPDDSNKLRDRLDTAVLEGKPYLVFDDLDRSYIRSGTLNSFMTADMWGGRRFHTQGEFSEEKKTVVFLTANNIETSSDLAGRMLTCDLFTSEANPQDRKIERPIDALWVRQPAIHGQLCRAAWAIIKDWIRTGRKHEGKLIAGFHTWAKVFGGLVMHAGFGDPCEMPATDHLTNGEYADMLALITRLADGVEKAHEYEFSEVVAVCRELNCFPNLLDGKLVKHREDGEEHYEFELSAKANSNMGKLLARYGGQTFTIEGPRRVVFGSRGKNRHRRYVLQVASLQ